MKYQNIDHETIREANKKKILNLLYKEKQLTKQEISRKINVSVPTVASIINELIEEGIVIEAGVGESSGGRKPVIIKFVEDARYSFGVDIRPDKVRVILTNLTSNIKCDKSFVIDKQMEFNDILDRVYKLVDEIIKEYKIEKNKVTGIGFSLPGIVDDEKLVLKIAPNMGAKNINFNNFKKLFGLPIYIENEANLSAYAELNLGIAKQMRNLVYVSVTQGIGTGIVIKDELYKGNNKIAGELGHMTIIKDGKQCNCGRRGCWEQYASISALFELYKDYSGADNVDMEKFIMLLNKKDEIALKVFNEYVDYLVCGLQNIFMILDPHYIILGGDIVKFGNELLDAISEKIFQNMDFYGDNKTKILLSRLKEDASILGASLLPFQDIFYLNNNII